MWLSFSKNLGSGIRVGFATNLKSPKKRGPTQRELAQMEKQAFLKKVATDSNTLLFEFLVNRNIEPEIADKKR